MKFVAFYKRNDPEEAWRFEDEPESVTLIGRTMGCGCCESNVPVSREGMAEHIASLEHELEKARKLQEDM